MAIIVAIIDNRTIIGRHVTILDSRPAASFGRTAGFNCERRRRRRTRAIKSRGFPSRSLRVANRNRTPPRGAVVEHSTVSDLIARDSTIGHLSRGQTRFRGFMVARLERRDSNNGARRIFVRPRRNRPIYRKMPAVRWIRIILLQYILIRVGFIMLHARFNCKATDEQNSDARNTTIIAYQPPAEINRNVGNSLPLFDEFYECDFARIFTWQYP